MNKLDKAPSQAVNVDPFVNEFDALLYSIDEGRFKALFNAVNIKPICLKCWYFNHTLQKTPNNMYKCRCAPFCAGATFCQELISYILWKIGKKSEKEHLNFLGI